MGKCFILGLLAAMVACGVVLAAEEDEDSYIKVEVRGTLQTGIVAIGGETTGTIIKVGDVTWELDLAGNKEFEKLARKLHNKTVLVAGTYRKVAGVEIPERHIVTVTKLASGE